VAEIEEEQEIIVAVLSEMMGCNMKELTKVLAEKLEQKKAREQVIKDKFKALEKVKKLTQEQRIARIEELLGLI